MYVVVSESKKGSFPKPNMHKETYGSDVLDFDHKVIFLGQDNVNYFLLISSFSLNNLKFQRTCGTWLILLFFLVLSSKWMTPSPIAQSIVLQT